MMPLRLSAIWLCILTAATVPAIAQPPAAAPAADVDATLATEVDALLSEMEVDPVVAAFIRSELIEGDDPMRALMLVSQSESPEMMWLFMSPFGGAQGAPQPTVTVLGPERVLIVDGHVAYVLNTATMKVEGTTAYARPSAAKRLEIVRAVRAMRAQAPQAGARGMGADIAEEMPEGPEATLQAHMTTLQNAVDLYNNDMGHFPQTLEEVAATDNPDPNYNGPYIRRVPEHPFGGKYGVDPATGEVWEKH